MNINDKIKEIATTASIRIKYINTEEGTKTAFVMPFISALGYDVFNPLEVVPEFTADIATKKGEKVDYAIKKDGKIIMLIECKQCGSDLSMSHKGQLYRYFSVTEAKFAILTNGINYCFFSDIDAPNKMDEKPFFEFDIINYNESHIEELSKFTKTAFNLEQIVNTASDLKYANAIKKSFAAEITNPSENFVKFLMSKVYSGRYSHSIIEQFNSIAKSAVKESISELVSNRLQSALQDEKESLSNEKIKKEMPKNNEQESIITEREIEGFNIVKAIARSTVTVGRIFMHHGKTHCAIMLDNNRRKPICRMYFHAKTKLHIGLFENETEKRYSIDTLDNIFDYGDIINKALENYLDRNKQMVNNNEQDLITIEDDTA